jgi:hypothetical protein
VLIGGTLLLAVVRAIAAVRAEGMTSLPDEIGFLGDAWLFGRGQPAPPMAFSPLYPGTYPLILGPFAAVTDDIETQLTIARLVNVALLAGLAPAVWALLGRWGRLAPLPRALAALAASALPGLSVAALRAWPDAFLALVWVLALLALDALARPGRLVRRVWFGPAVGLLAAAHARFTPVVALAAAVLVLRLVRPPEEGDGRGAEILNLVGLVAVFGGGRVVDGIVSDARWSRVAPDATDLLRDQPGRVLGDVFPSLAGQWWFVIVTTFGVAAVGAVAAARIVGRAGRRGRALWCEPVPLVVGVALLGAVGVEIATAVQLKAGDVLGTTTFDLLANGRYQEVTLAPLVALGLGRMVRRDHGRIGVELGIAAAAIATAVFVQQRLPQPAPVLDAAFVPAWSRDPVDLPTVVPTAVGLVVLALLVLLRPSPDDLRRVAAVPLLVLVALTAIGVERSERLIDASEEGAAGMPDLSAVRVALHGDPVAMSYENRTLWATIIVGWQLAPEGVESYVAGEEPPLSLVIAPIAEDGQPDVEGLEGAKRIADIPPSASVRLPLALWELPEG